MANFERLVLGCIEAEVPPQRGAALFCFLLGLLYLSHSAAAFEIGPSFLIRGAGVAMGQQDLANRWTFPLPLGTWELAAGQECSGQKFSSAYCALCVLSGGSWAPCFWGRQGHLPCFPHVGNLFSPAPFSWCFSSLRLGPWSNPCFLYVLRRSVRSVDRRRGWPGEWEPNPPTRSRLGVRLAGRVGSNPTDSVLD